MWKIPPPPELDWCLFLDVDGTLIELSDAPSQTVADPPLKHLLSTLFDRLQGALALVSGRSIERLDEIFTPLRLPTAGLHGVERRTGAGGHQGANFIDPRLTQARADAKKLAAAHPGILIEDKGRTLAVHYRLAPTGEHKVRAALFAMAEQLGSDYHIQEGSMVLEVKPRQFSKATAIKAFTQEPPFAGRRPVFVGDDLTDQDGFKMVEDLGGISIAVGNRVRAQHHIDTVSGVRVWLQRIADLH